jgi:transcription initiation factor TFIID subunit 12
VQLQGTPSALKNPSDETWVTDETSSRRKSTPGDASMRRSIQDLVLSIDPNVKIEPEVEDVRPLCYLGAFRCSRTTFSYSSC